MKPIAPKISDSAADFLPATFSSINAGATYIIDAFPALYRKTLAEIREKFTLDELSLIIDVFNATLLTPQMSGQHIIIQCTDAIELDRQDEKWSIDKTTLIEKLKSLTIFQSACIEIWANGFWYSKKRVEKPGMLEEYIKKIW